MINHLEIIEDNLVESLTDFLGTLESWFEKAQSLDRADFPIQFWHFQVLERLYENLSCIAYLLPTKNRFINSLSLIQRNILADFIIECYCSISNDDPKVKNDRYYSIFLDDIKRTRNNVRRLGEDENLISSNLIDHIEDYCRNNNVKPAPALSQMVEELLQGNKFELKQLIFEAFDIWIILSKSEHFGLYSYTHVRSTDRNKILSRIAYTLKFSMLVIINSFEQIGEQDLARIVDKQFISFYEKMNLTNLWSLQ